MAKDPDNVHIWANAAVRLFDGATRPVLPADIDTPFTELAFPEVGILDGDAGFGEERSVDETKHFGWGIGLIKIGSKNYELSRTFSPLEDNAVVRGLVWPGSTATKILMPKPVYRWIAFENTSDEGLVERLVSTRKARIWVAANARNESDITKWEVSVNLFANGADEVFDRQATVV